MNPVEEAILALDEGRPKAALALLAPLAAAGRLGPLGQLTLGRASLADGDAGRAVGGVARGECAEPQLGGSRRRVRAGLAAKRGAAGRDRRVSARAEDRLPVARRRTLPWRRPGCAAGEPERALPHLEAAERGGFDGAALRAELDAMRGAARANAAYVRALFDQFSADYDERMRGKLGYRAPEILFVLAAMVSGGKLKKAATLDLGCGTGLAAPCSGRSRTVLLASI